MVEKEYIEREKVILAIANVPEGNWSNRRYVAEIEKLPSADVRPVVSGTWVKAIGSYMTPGGDPVWQCSRCGKGTHVYGVEHGSYGSDVADKQWVSCPNCGADMRDAEPTTPFYDLLYEEGGANTT